jgi:hypothetical protein
MKLEPKYHIIITKKLYENVSEFKYAGKSDKKEVHYEIKINEFGKCLLIFS